MAFLYTRSDLFSINQTVYTSIIFIEAVSDTIIKKMHGHGSAELERYKHLSPSFSATNDRAIIAGKLVDESEGNANDPETAPKNEKAAQTDDSRITDN